MMIKMQDQQKRLTHTNKAITFIPNKAKADPESIAFPKSLLLFYTTTIQSPSFLEQKT